MQIHNQPNEEYKISDELFLVINTQLEKYGLRWGQKKLAQAVLELSNHFNQNSIKQSLWHDKNLQAAYLAYFLPLNILRIMSLKTEIEFLFNNDTEIIDFGSGPGSFHLALLAELKLPFKNIEFIEKDLSAIGMHKDLIRGLTNNNPMEWTNGVNLQTKDKLGVFSYALNELETYPKWLFDFESIIIIEPSTQMFGRKLMELRAQLMEHGFQILAPCTHQTACPLLTQSKKDWCHHRIPIKMPHEWLALEKQLPMKNNTITFSYLVASKTVQNKNVGSTRVIGDTLKEKGKTRQAICRNNDREFLSWLKKNKNAEKIPRGSLIQLPEDLEKKGDEVRV
jgi:hypothetical protein